MDERSARGGGDTRTVPPRPAARRRRVRASIAFWVTVSVVLVGVAATSGPGGAVPDLEFRQVGHWVYSSTLGKVFHVNGASKAVDAAADVEGGRLAGGPAVQGPGSVYVPGENGTAIEFGKSRLRVKARIPTGVNELPVGLEVPGGPYYVYRTSGIVQRLAPLVTIRVGGSLGAPVATPDGTVWLLRQTDGAVCSLPRTATEVSCPGRAPAGHRGALTVLGQRPAFVDTTSSEVRLLDSGGLGPAMPLGTPVGDDAKVAPADAAGRLPIVRPRDRSLLLVDTTRLAPGRQPAAPRKVQLESADVSTPAAAGRSVAIVDNRNDKLVTYDLDGEQVAQTDLPVGAGVRLSRAQDGRVYAHVEGSTDSAVVIDGGGEIADVPLTDPVPGSDPSRPAAPTPAPTGTPDPTDPTDPTEPTEAPDPTDPADPSGTPDPTGTPGPTGTPDPTDPTDPTGRPEPTRTPEPTGPPEPSAEPRPTAEPEPPAPDPTTGPGRPPGDGSPRATVPGAPRSVRATVDGTGAVLTWRPGPSNGAPITAYQVSWRTAAEGTVVRTATVPAGARQSSVAGLVAGTAYVAAVAAENRAGRGVAAESNPVTPVTTGPGAPTAVRAAADGTDGSVAVTFTPAAGATGHTVTASNGAVLPAAGARAVFPSLPVGGRYTFTVAAVDAAGRTGPASAPSNPAVPYRPAAAPTGVQATRGDGAVAVAWAAAALNGGELVGYQVTAAGLPTRTVTGRTATVDGLTAGRAYPITVRAVTREQGSGAGPTVPGAVSAPVAVTAAAAPTVDVLAAEQAAADGPVTVTVQVDDGAAAMVGCQVTIGTQAHTGLTCPAGRSTLRIADGPAGGAAVPVTATGTNQVGTGRPGRAATLTPVAAPTGAVANGTYRLRSAVTTDNVLDINDCETKNDAEVRMWTSGESGHCQQFRIASLGGDLYSIIETNSGKTLDTCDEDDWQHVRLWDYEGHECQKWRIEPAEDGAFFVRAQNSGRGLQPDDCINHSDADVYATSFSGSRCQSWHLED